MWHGWRFGLVIARMPLCCLSIAACALLFLVGRLYWKNSFLESALQTERSLVVSMREEVVMMNGAFLAAQSDAQQARQEVAVLKNLLRDAAPNIVLLNMTTDDIRRSAFLIVDINDLGTDEFGMAYSTTTLVNAHGRRVMYGFKVDERNLDLLSRALLRGGRIAVERQKKFFSTQ